MAISEPTDLQHWPVLKASIEKCTGFICNQYTDTFLMRRVLSRLIVLKLNSYEEYMRYLNTTPEEPGLLLRELTIHVTNFFRDQSMWQTLITKTIPEIAAHKRAMRALPGMDSVSLSRTKKIVIWSAGCSSGEEPISCAIACFEALGSTLSNFEVKIIATDIDAGIISKAKTATYSSTQCKELPLEYTQKYFDVISTHKGPLFSEEILRPKPAVYALIAYRTADILNDPAPEQVDLILCRNTVIYFNLETKSLLYTKFYNALQTPGYLILGKTELLQGPSREQFQIADSSERIYKKM